MELIELETGLYLDIKIQKLLERIFNIEADKMIVIDELHGSDSLLVFEQIATGLNPIIKRTIIVDSENEDYKIKIYNFKNKQFAQISNNNKEFSTFIIKSNDFYNWKNEITILQKRLFV